MRSNERADEERIFFVVCERIMKVSVEGMDSRREKNSDERNQLLQNVSSSFGEDERERGKESNFSPFRHPMEIKAPSPKVFCFKWFGLNRRTLQWY